MLLMTPRVVFIADGSRVKTKTKQRKKKETQHCVFHCLNYFCYVESFNVFQPFFYDC